MSNLVYGSVYTAEHNTRLIGSSKTSNMRKSSETGPANLPASKNKVPDASRLNDVVTLKKNHDSNIMPDLLNAITVTQHLPRGAARIPSRGIANPPPALSPARLPIVRLH